MKLDPAAYHNICSLTTNVAVSRPEAETWKKCLLNTADEKIRVQKFQLTVNLLRKLQRAGVGVNSVEIFAKKNSGEGTRREKRRRRMTQLMMKAKVEDAEMELKWSKERLDSKMRKLERRWGHHQGVMTAFRSIVSKEAIRVWEQGKDKNAKKVDHLRRKWRSGLSRAVDQEWRGIKIGDRVLEEEMRNEQEEARHPHKYGGVQTNADEDSILALPHKFTTFEKIQLDKIKVSTEILKDKVRWELRAREEREGRPWSEEWEFQQQDEKEVFRSNEKKMEFARRRVTDMPTNRDIRIPDPAHPNVETVLDNISCKISEVANNYIKNKCDKRGNILQRNLNLSQKNREV